MAWLEQREGCRDVVLVDEPVANRHLASLGKLNTIIAERCRRLNAATLRPHTDFHWQPSNCSSPVPFEARWGATPKRLTSPRGF
jgi:hypothetical protein